VTDSLNGIINQLERQKTAIEHALGALQGIEGIEASNPVPAASALATRKGGMTPAGRRRLSAALKKRWAAKKAAEAEPAVTPAPTVPEPPKPKRRISAEGMKRIIAATKKRWRLQRAAAKSAQVK
jgi:hypothetical protein